MSGMVKLVETAMQAGQGWARVQLLRASHCQYRYVTSEGTMTFPVHDAQTLAELDGGSRQRAQLARPAFDVVLWLRGQGLGVLCATSALAKGRLGREPALAPWLYLVAVFVPVDKEEAQLEEVDLPRGRLFSLWNTQYMPKCLDATAVGTWALRVQRALETGASRCLLCTLYRNSDFSEIAVDEQTEAVNTLACLTPRDHLTMQPISARRWVLDKRLLVLVGFARQYGYAWTLCHPSVAEPQWAYFAILLDPLTQYEQLK